MAEKYIERAAEGIRQAATSAPEQPLPATTAPAMPEYHIATPDMDAVERICQFIENGSSTIEPFRHRADPQHSMYGIPTRAMFYAWVASDSEARDRYTRAKQGAADFYAGMVGDVAMQVWDEPDKDRSAAGREAIRGFMWTAERMDPTVYAPNANLNVDLGDNFMNALARVERATRSPRKRADAIDVEATTRQVTSKE